MAKTLFQANWKPDIEKWELLVDDIVFHMSEKVFSDLVNRISALPMPKDREGDLEIVFDNHVLTLKGLSSIQFARMKEYLELCEASQKSWRENHES